VPNGKLSVLSATSTQSWIAVLTGKPLINVQLLARSAGGRQIAYSAALDKPVTCHMSERFRAKHHAVAKLMEDIMASHTGHKWRLVLSIDEFQRIKAGRRVCIVTGHDKAHIAFFTAFKYAYVADKFIEFLAKLDNAKCCFTGA
jgi:hypothetical protein